MLLRYTKFVIKSIGKVETLLKVVLAPLDPPEIIIQNYLLLNEDQDVAAAAAGGDAGKAAADALTPQKLQEFRDGFIKILDLKVW